MMMGFCAALFGLSIIYYSGTYSLLCDAVYMKYCMHNFLHLEEFSSAII